MSILVGILLIFLTVSISGGFVSQIVGGERARIKKYPHQVSIRRYGRNICGGSIIGPLHILTAAHCIQPKYGLVFINIDVISGADDKKKKLNNNQVHRVAKISYHRDFVYQNNHTNDIAILELAEEIFFSPSQRAINLPDIGVPHDKISIATFSGWGRQGPEERIARYLHHCWMGASGQDDLVRRLGVEIHPGQLCATTPNGQHTAKGDSGSGLILDKAVVGVLSQGAGTCKRIAIFTPVYPYKSWINDIIKKH